MANSAGKFQKRRHPAELKPANIDWISCHLRVKLECLMKDFFKHHCLTIDDIKNLVAAKSCALFEKGQHYSALMVVVEMDPSKSRCSGIE